MVSQLRIIWKRTRTASGLTEARGPSLLEREVERQASKELRLQQKREALEERERANCTFNPKINEDHVQQGVAQTHSTERAGCV